ncbi:hypothetical protein [Prevotella histicola]|uniref:Uncharacterized protein n=1 Tax=Prevotella histicola JCM 15637 = DNF00424 TaxID=1236504 RepID=A0AAW3FD03_9BACT|nr:hypothetical protein [Prevotella histicola]KGF24822.1 hypothetical protein HMPREF2132_11015 [Prevotella histicola JCM 15637 = DNF00424]
MSHSRIIQVSKERVEENERLDSSSLELDELLHEIDGVDYVMEPDSSREVELDWLKEQLDKVGFTLDGEKITVGKDETFLSDWREKAIEVAEEFSLWKMKEVASGVYFCAFYIYDAEFGYLMPLWEWAKQVLGNDQTYYVGGIIDYHY